MNYTYEMFQQDVDIIVEQVLQSDFKPSFIAGFARGGLPLGVVLSHKLKIPFTPIIVNKNHYQFAGSDVTAEKVSTQFIIDPMLMYKVNHYDHNILIVDDIFDSGETISKFLEYANFKKEQFRTACLIYNVTQPIEADFYGIEINRDEFKDWVNFWWEM